MSTGNVKGKAHLAGVYALSLLSILLWGLSYLWSDSLLSKGIPVEYIVFVRIFIAGLVLLVVNLLTGNNLKMKKQDLPKFLLLALFEPFIYFVAETYPFHGIADYQCAPHRSKSDFLRCGRRRNIQGKIHIFQYAGHLDLPWRYCHGNIVPRKDG